MIRLRSFHLRPSGFTGQVAPARQARHAVIRLLTLVVAMVVGGSSSAFACPVCFGAEETSMIDGTRLGILVLLAITLTVQAGFVAFFLYLRRRAKRIADIDLETEWSELQGGATRT
jgi:hypothetical protein